MILFAIIIVAIIGSMGFFMVNHISKTIEKQFKYHLDVLKVTKGDMLKLDDSAFEKGEVPILTVKIDKHPINFLLDSGANINLINKSVYESLGLTNNEILPGTSIVGAEGTMKGDSYSADIKFKHKQRVFDEHFEIMDMDNSFGAIEKKDGVLIHGILGSKFFAKHKWTLDFEDLVVWIKKSN